jgi:hypothetical protein
MSRRSTCSRSDKMFDVRRFQGPNPMQLLSAEDAVDESPQIQPPWQSAEGGGRTGG